MYRTLDGVLGGELHHCQSDSSYFLNGVFEVVGIEKYSEQFGLRSPRLSYLSRFVSLFIHEEKMRKMEYLLACSGDKIQSFQFDKKETSASKLLMEFTRRM